MEVCRRLLQSTVTRPALRYATGQAAFKTQHYEHIYSYVAGYSSTVASLDVLLTVNLSIILVTDLLNAHILDL